MTPDRELLEQAVAKAEFPVKLACLFEPKRYKVLYGGRGGAKSWGVARALLIKGAKDPLRILCARETLVARSACQQGGHPDDYKRL